ncbi:MAG: DNA polymerase III subunit delta [Pygmaiobacter sp.]
MTALNSTELARTIKTGRAASAWLLYSFDEYLLSSFTSKLVDSLCAEIGEDATVIAGPVPQMGDVVAAAGAISLFGTKRIVLLSHLDIAAMKPEDIALLAELCGEVENAVLIFTLLLKEPQKTWRGAGELKPPAAAKVLISAVEKVGVVAALEKPNEGGASAYVQKLAKAAGTDFCDAAAAELVRRCGVDLRLLRAETEKLAAASGYTEITTALVQQLATHNIEADVFELSKHILAGRADRAFCLLEELLYLQNEPIMIAAALTGSYIDMYRVKCGAKAQVSYGTVFRELGYKGSDYRLKKSLEAAAGYETEQLADCLEILAKLDKKLKGSTVDRKALLQLAVGELLLCGKNRRKYAH